MIEVEKRVKEIVVLNKMSFYQNIYKGDAKCRMCVGLRRSRILRESSDIPLRSRLLSLNTCIIPMCLPAHQARGSVWNNTELST